MEETLKTLRFVQRLIIGIAAASLVFIISPPDTEKYREALAELDSLRGLKKEYSSYVEQKRDWNDKVEGFFKEAGIEDLSYNTNSYDHSGKYLVLIPETKLFDEMFREREPNPGETFYMLNEINSLHRQDWRAFDPNSLKPYKEALSKLYANYGQPTWIDEANDKESEFVWVDFVLTWEQDKGKREAFLVAYLGANDYAGDMSEEVRIPLRPLRKNNFIAAFTKKIKRSQEGRLFPALSSVMPLLKGQTIDDTEVWLQDRIANFSSTIEVVGLKLQTNTVIVLMPLISTLFLFYFFLNLRHFNRLIKQKKETEDFPWLGAYPDIVSRLSLYVILASPTVASLILVFSIDRSQDFWCWGAAFSFTSLVVNLMIFFNAPSTANPAHE